MAAGQLFNSNINRSPTSYLLNPQEERDMYPEGDTDKNMTLVKLTDKSGNLIGTVNWFAVHGTAMNNTNTLVSGDNKGYAEYALEKELNGPDSVPGMGPIVAAFASCNLGDVSPNTKGAMCLEGPNAGLPCDAQTSTCPDDKGRMRNEKCIAFGPGKDMFESTKIIGDNQFQFAKKLLSQKGTAISGPIDYRFSWVEMKGRKVTLADGTTTQLCTPAFGYSFAAGTTDGPGMFNFAQGELTPNPFWNLVRDVLSKPTKEEKQCQHPKPILLNLGDVNVPHAWVSSTIPVQVLRIGNFFILATSSELTTMSGRRLRKSVYNQIRNNRLVPEDQEIYVVIAGLANGYQDYIVTPEEYQAQRYEAGSTLFGPNSLPGLIQEFTRIVDDMIQGRPSTSDPAPADILDQMISLHPPPKLDMEPDSAKFGDVVPDTDVDPSKKYRAGKDVISVSFYGASPRHRIRDQESYLSVEKVTIPTGIPEVSNPLIDVVALDGDWSTKFSWAVDNSAITNTTSAAEFELQKAVVSIVKIDWEIPSGTGPGEYRVCYSGDAKTHLKGPLRPIRGCSSIFTII